MKAIVQRRYGPPEQVLELATVEPPAVGPDDVLFRVHASSVNTPDWITVTGVPYFLRLASGLRRPRVPVRGSDVAGVVETVGENVTDFAPGDEVFGSVWDNRLNNRAGAFAEFAVAPASQLIHKPEALSFVEAAASVMSGITAMTAMRDVAGVGQGTSVLINGASGGVGTFAVQIARALGAEVTGVCSTRNVEMVRSLGAADVIDYTETDFTKGERRYDVILDNVLNHRPRALTRRLNPNGLLIPNSVGDSNRRWLAGVPRIAMASLLGIGSTRVETVTCVVDRDNLTVLADMIESGSVQVVIDQVYPLREAAAAVAHMLGHRSRGKVAISG